jgi:MGT family glycosyltransferase
VSRYLFVVPPLAGHVNPAVSVAAELAGRGHAIAWAAHERLVHPLLPDASAVYAMPEAISPAAIATLHEPAGSRWLGRLQLVWEKLFLPLARTMLPAVEAAIDDFDPDALVVDQYALAGALAARRRQLPWVTSAAIWFPLSPFLDTLPAARAWVIAQLDELQRGAGLEPVTWPDRSPDLVLVYTTRALVGDEPNYPTHYRFVGPAVGGRPEPPFPWADLRPGGRVFVSLGSVQAEAGGRFYTALVDALRDRAEQVIVAAPPELMPHVPGTFLVQRYVPQLTVLARVDAVVCHGGFNTVSEALFHGLPLVVAPIADDQMLNAHTVVSAGAGIRVRYGRVGSTGLRRAVSAVLDEPGYREAARRIAGSFEAAGGAPAAADAIEELAT